MQWKLAAFNKHLFFWGNVVTVYLKINLCQRWAEQLLKLPADIIS